LENGELSRKVLKMYQDMYEGTDKDNPPITARLLLLEESVEKINSNLSKMVWLLLSILGAAVGNIFLHLAGK
jgi:hypothetical protein